MEESLFVKIIPPLFLLFILILSNFTGEILSCKFIKYAQENYILKHFIAFMALFFTIIITLNFLGEDNLDIKFNLLSPLHKLFVTFIIYLLFLILNRCDFKYLATTLILFSIIYIIEMQQNHLLKINSIGVEQSNAFNLVKNVLSFICVVVILVGFKIYYSKKREEYKNIWSNWNFILGRYNNVTKSGCKNNDQGRFKVKDDSVYLMSLK